MCAPDGWTIICFQANCSTGPPSDKQNFVALVRELSDEFKLKGLLLTAAVSPNKKVIDAAYDVPALNKYLDYIYVMAYDYYGGWDPKTGHNSPLHHHPDLSDPTFSAVSIKYLTLPNTMYYNDLVVIFVNIDLSFLCRITQ